MSKLSNKSFKQIASEVNKMWFLFLETGELTKEQVLDLEENIRLLSGHFYAQIHSMNKSIISRQSEYEKNKEEEIKAEKLKEEMKEILK